MTPRPYIENKDTSNEGEESPYPKWAWSTRPYSTSLVDNFESYGGVRKLGYPNKYLP